MEATRPRSQSQGSDEANEQLVTHPEPQDQGAPAPGQWFFDTPGPEAAGMTDRAPSVGEKEEHSGTADSEGEEKETADNASAPSSVEGESKAPDTYTGKTGASPAEVASAASREDDNNPDEDDWLSGLRPPEPVLPKELTAAADMDSDLPDSELADVDAFTREVKADEILVGLVSEDEIRRHEEALEQKRLEAAREKARIYAEEQKKLLEMEETARRRVERQEKETTERLRQRASALNINVANRESSIRRVFSRAKEELQETLKKQKAVVYEKYGKLEEGRAGAREFRIEWERLPQPLQLHLDLMKAVKDKLPNGRYSVLVTLFDRLGGAPMRWTKLRKDQGGTGPWRPAASRPFRHRGRFYDTEAIIDDDIYVTCPPERDIRPSNVIIFELFQLGNKRRPVDRVVAWTALPICDPNFRAVQGRFMLPLLRGEVDFNIVRFVSMERRISRDLDSWLCNLYLDVRHLPREVVFNNTLYKEYDVELSYTSELLRLRGTGRHVDLSQNEEEKEVSAAAMRAANLSDEEEEDEWESDEELWDADASGVPVVVPGGVKRDKSGRVRGLKKGYIPLPTEEEEESSPVHGAVQRSAFFGSSPASEREFWSKSSPGRSPLGSPDTLGVRHETRKLNISGIGTLSPVNRAGAVAMTGAERYKNRQHFRFDAGLAAVPETKEAGGEEKKEDQRGVFHRPDVKEQLVEGSSEAAEYSYAVTRQKLRGLRGRRVKESKRKMRFLRHEMISDLRLSHWKSFDFWVQLVLLLLAFWTRIYMHYIGQYVFLQMLRVPVYNFEATWYNCIVKYVAQVIPMEYELGVVMAGVSSNILLFCIFMFTSWLSLTLLGTFPETLSRFVAGFGFFTVLDPLLIFLVDLMSSNWNCQSFPECAGDIANAACRCSEGDAFKLYYRFKSSEGSGVIGVTLTVFVYIVLFLIALFFLYVFLLNLYLNGRMLDVYRRIYADDNAFTLPADHEVSPAELQWVLMKAKRWRGPKGTSRKIAVCDYILTDPLDTSFREVTTHVVIYHASLDGSRELYRHFLRLPDGTIVEVFGNMEKQFGMKTNALDDVLSKKDKTKDEDVSRFFSDLVRST